MFLEELHVPIPRTLLPYRFRHPELLMLRVINYNGRAIYITAGLRELTLQLSRELQSMYTSAVVCRLSYGL